MIIISLIISFIIVFVLKDNTPTSIKIREAKKKSTPYPNDNKIWRFCKVFVITLVITYILSNYQYLTS